jgi:hypothetical protein
LLVTLCSDVLTQFIHKLRYLVFLIEVIVLVVRVVLLIREQRVYRYLEGELRVLHHVFRGLESIVLLYID